MLQFCSCRWVEGVLVAERAVEVWPNVVKYVNETLKKKKHIPAVASFHTVHEYSKDTLVLTKLQLFISADKIVEPFLKKYQTDATFFWLLISTRCCAIYGVDL